MSLAAVLAHAVPDTALTWGPREAAFYALSVGLTPEDGAGALPFLYEGLPGGLCTLPAFAVPLADPGFWQPASPLDATRCVHLAERVELASAIPAEGRALRSTRILHAADKGEGRGALVVAEGAVEALGLRTVQTVMARGDGGTGESLGEAPPRTLPAIPDRAPDAVVTRPVLPQQALLYRWNGDMNPLHADPAAARAAGFDRPILHGLCTLGMASVAAMAAFGLWRPDAFAAIEARFAAPVFPGEVLDVALWREGAAILARVTVNGRTVLDPAAFTLRRPEEPRR